MTRTRHTAVSVLTALCLCFLPPAALGLAASPTATAPNKAANKAPNTAPDKSAAAKGESVDISGRVVAGLDQVFIKDATQGYFLVQGVNLAPYSGRFVSAKGVVVRQEAEYRIVRLTHYRIQSPDDDTPGAGGEVKVQEPANPAAKRKK